MHFMQFVSALNEHAYFQPENDQVRQDVLYQN